MGQRYHGQLATSFGPISFAVDADGRLIELRFAALAGRRPDRDSRCDRVAEQLAEYLAGQRTRFDLVTGAQGTPFQRRVWRALQDVPYGVVVSYGEIAQRIDMPNGARAVGQANGANPIPIVVPCHRVIAADGTIGGFSSGSTIKRRLLAVEHVRLAA
jgi:methylated-DNA-[protein]-cysteine S-methyltransferase